MAVNIAFRTGILVTGLGLSNTVSSFLLKHTPLLPHTQRRVRYWANSSILVLGARYLDLLPKNPYILASAFAASLLFATLVAPRGSRRERGNNTSEPLPRQGASAPTASTYPIDTLLSEAVLDQDEDRIHELIRNGADLNEKIEFGQTALHVAVDKGYAKIVTILLNAGADVHAKNERGFTPLHDASLYGEEGIVGQLLKARADVNARDKAGNTSLHYSSKVEIAKHLLKRGADVNAQNNEGETPLDLARRERDSELINRLEYHMTLDPDLPSMVSRDGPSIFSF